jgi:hypothetical protein
MERLKAPFLGSFSKSSGTEIAVSFGVLAMAPLLQALCAPCRAP